MAGRPKFTGGWKLVRGQWMPAVHGDVPTQPAPDERQRDDSDERLHLERDHGRLGHAHSMAHRTGGLTVAGGNRE